MIGSLLKRGSMFGCAGGDLQTKHDSEKVRSRY